MLLDVAVCVDYLFVYWMWGWAQSGEIQVTGFRCKSPWCMPEPNYQSTLDDIEGEQSAAYLPAHGLLKFNVS